MLCTFCNTPKLPRTYQAKAHCILEQIILVLKIKVLVFFISPIANTKFRIDNKGLRQRDKVLYC